MDLTFELIGKEKIRQAQTLMLIPSENYSSKQVQDVVGSVLMNKYSEGYPGKRYYQGNRFVDEIELLAIERAKKLFSVEHVNVQPYSGSPANMAVYMALVEPGETVMGLSLSGGGHLTHGHPNITFSGRYYKSVQYGVDGQGFIDYDDVLQKAVEFKPRLIICGTTSYPRAIDFEKFASIADQVGALLLADISHIAGLVAGGVHSSPIGVADVVTTTTHKTLRGPRGAMIMTQNPELAKKIDRAVFPGLQGGPHNNVTAGIAVAFGELLQTEKHGTVIEDYARAVVENAKALAHELLALGYTLTTGGTDNHLMVLDLRDKQIGGKDAAVLLEKNDIIVNYNAVPHDPNPPGNPSGIRLGTPALTSRGMGPKEMKLVASLIDQVFKGTDVAGQVLQLTSSFPVPEHYGSR